MRRLGLFLLLLLPALPLPACTTAVISGKATKDGRPILWKNRDAADIHNQVFYGRDGRFPYLGVVNRGDVAGLQIWAGVNDQGFAIMNNVSYNVETKGEDSAMEGTLMKLALQSCATVDDFQALLERSNFGGRDVAANFGVVDAKGGAAYFEADAKGFKRFDAATAPGGFLVRANYSHSGKRGEGAGFIREARAQELVSGLHQEGRLLPETLLTEVCRDTANTRIGSFPARTRSGFAYIGDSLSRHETSSCFVLAGVKPGEAPALSTAWVVLGLPVTGVAVPLWVEAGVAPAEVATQKDFAPLHAAFDRVRLHLYPEQPGELKRYLSVPRLYDPKEGLLEPFLALERENFASVREGLKAGIPRRELQERVTRQTHARVLEVLTAKRIPESGSGERRATRLMSEVPACGR